MIKKQHLTKTKQNDIIFKNESGAFNMKKEWESVVINKIISAVYVPEGKGNQIHKNRPFHGFVINDTGSDKDYHFPNGYTMNTYDNTMFYLPKGSFYEVKSAFGDCYAINFEADISDEPFYVNLKNPSTMRKLFKSAFEEWRAQSETRHPSAMSAVYEAISAFLKEQKKSYVPSAKFLIITPALEEIERNFSNSELRIEDLALLCGISEVYLRKLFQNRYGISPKEYIIKKRMDYACQLLLSKQFEVNEVAQLCGYGEPCHFSREFKNHLGVCPKNYK